MPISPDLLELAPRNLRNHRDNRYDGGGMGVLRADFAPPDLALVERIYGSVTGFFDAWKVAGPATNLAEVAPLLEEFGADEFMQAAQKLGHASESAGRSTPELRKAIHDIRGGGLTVLVGTAQMFRFGMKGGPALQTCANIARDHAKIMRNAVEDIDPPVRAADEASKAHGISHFTEKWSGAEVQVAGRPVKVAVDCSYRGDISARCLETSAIDRILYNFVNNAARFTADGVVRLDVFSVTDSLTRWVVSNAVADDHRAWLARNVSDLGQLFRGGLTRGGEGIGLTNCADFVTATFGLAKPDDAINRGYLGAKVLGDRYHAWFHWPSYSRPAAA